MKKAMLIPVMGSLFWFSGLTTASAILLIDTGVPPSLVASTNIYNNQFAAQEFTLLTGATITEIAPFMSKEGTGADPVVKVQVTDAIGPGTPLSALIAEFSLTVTSPTFSPAFLPIPTSFFLPAGTFFVVYSGTTSFSDAAKLWANAPTNIGDDFAAFGTALNSSFPPASTWELQTGISANYGLRISGDPIPEPGTLLLLGSGLAGLGAKALARRRREPALTRTGIVHTQCTVAQEEEAA